MNRSTRLLRLLAVLACTLVLQACGTPYATVKNPRGDDVMLLGYDPVAYFTAGKPTRGSREITSTLPSRTYYFASAENKRLFDANPAKFEPQYGGFCSSGAAFALKLGSDPTSWEIYQGRLFIFGDVLGHEAWKLDRDWNIRYADQVWPEMKDAGWRGQSLSRYASKVPWYKTGRDIREEYAKKYPGKPWPNYDVGSMFTNLFTKPPGWRAAEGHSQPAVGYPD
ncbi:MAG: hypothetical protein JNM90_23780 [Burkholderiales bacterium]|nr:hypothetical protein [Burkholderiales bacterium]